MNSTKHTSLSVFQKVFLSTLVGCVIFLVSQAIASYFLLKVPYFERYYRLATGIGLFLVSTSILLINRKDFLSVIISALVFIILSVVIGLILSYRCFSSLALLIQYAIFFVATVGLYFCFYKHHTSRKKSKNFRFKK